MFKNVRRPHAGLVLALLSMGVFCRNGAAGEANEFSIMRERMVENQLRARDISSPGVLRAMGKVPREEFVPEGLKNRSYDDNPLPIGYGQTISQPYIVALMTQLLDLGEGARVLEVGTGSGYQSAVLSPLAEKVYSVEIIPELGDSARERLKRVGFKNVSVRVGDGYYGWPEEAPFDAIVVTAAATHVPPPLIRQLKEGGKMVIPVGGQFFVQRLLLVEKEGGKVKSRSVTGVRFVPLTGGHKKPPKGE